LTSIGIGILDQWRIGYLECQRDIKVLSDLYFNRWAWEFDEDTIYDRLNFVRMVVMDLQKILEVNRADGPITFIGTVDGERKRGPAVQNNLKETRRFPAFTGSLGNSFSRFFSFTRSVYVPTLAPGETIDPPRVHYE